MLKMTEERAETTKIGAMGAEITTNSAGVEVASRTMKAGLLQGTTVAVLGTNVAVAEATEERTKDRDNPDRIDVAVGAVTKIKVKAEEEEIAEKVVIMLAGAKVVEVIATTTSVSSLMRTVPTPL